VQFFANIGFDPIFSVLGILLVIGGIVVLVRIWVSRRRISAWEHVAGSGTNDRDRQEYNSQ